MLKASLALIISSLSKQDIFAIFSLFLTAVSFGVIGYVISNHFAILVFDTSLAEFTSIFQLIVSSLGFIGVWLTLLLVVDLVSFILIDKRDFSALFRLWTPITLVLLSINIFNYFEIESILDSIGPNLVKSADLMYNDYSTKWLRIINHLGYLIVFTYGVKVIRSIYDTRWTMAVAIIAVPFVLIFAIRLFV